MSSVYQKSALAYDFKVVGAPYPNTACVVMTQLPPGVGISPATAMPAVSGHCKSTCILQRVEILDAEASGFAMNQLL